MGRSRTWAYSLVIDGGGPNVVVTPMEWRVGGRRVGSTREKGYGKPTAANLVKFVEGYMRSLEAGGSNAHLAKHYGFIPYPNWAKIVRNDGSREVVAEWKAPMFMAVGPALPPAGKATAAYHTWAHNIDMCLRNGSYVRKDADGKCVQYMNGDCMGEVGAVPAGMTAVPTEKAKRLLPACCK